MADKGDGVPESTTEKSDDGAPCIVCREPLKPGAQKCTKCSSYQSRLRNFVEFWARNVGLAAAFVAVIFWIVTTYPAVHAMFTKPRIDIVTARTFLNGPGAVVIANAGDHDVFISHIRFFDGITEGPQSFAKRIDIFKPLPPHQFVQQGDINPLHAQMLIVSDIDDAAWTRILESNDRCYQRQFFYERDQEWIELRGRYPGVKTFRAGGYIVYSTVSRPDDPQRRTFPVVGVVWREVGCKSK